MKKKISILYWSVTGLVTVVSILSFWGVFSNQQPRKTKSEAYLPELNTINSLEKVTQLFETKLERGDTLEAVNHLDEFLRNRFYHGYSRYTMNDNWMAYLAGYVWLDFKLVVSPKETPKYASAACSQQAIIFQTVLKEHGVRFRTVAFDPIPGVSSGHYALEVYVNGQWHYYDTNLEPTVVGDARPSLEEILRDSLYLQMYNKEFSTAVQDMFRNTNVYPRDENYIPGGKMIFFQNATGFLSNYLFLFLLLGGVLFFRFWKD